MGLLKDLYKKPTLKAIAKSPPAKRDFDFVFKKDLSKASEILSTAEEVFGELLEEAFIFDVYEGEKIAPDEISVAVRVLLRHPERSLEDEEVNNLSKRFIDEMERKGFRLRG